MPPLRVSTSAQNGAISRLSLSGNDIGVKFLFGSTKLTTPFVFTYNIVAVVIAHTYIQLLNSQIMKRKILQKTETALVEKYLVKNYHHLEAL